jgi:hypothetical protein
LHERLCTKKIANKFNPIAALPVDCSADQADDSLLKGEGSMTGLTEPNSLRVAPGDHLSALAVIKVGLGAFGMVTVSLLLALLQ